MNFCPSNCSETSAFWYGPKSLFLIPADFSNVHFKCSRLLCNCGNIKPLYGTGWGGHRLEIADDRSELWRDSQSWQNRIWLSLLPYDIPQANTQIKFCKNVFHTLQGTMFHRPLTNTSSLKITAAYSVYRSMTPEWRNRERGLAVSFLGMFV